MEPVVDRTLVAAIVGPIVGLAVMKGYVAPQNANQITQLADTVIGGSLALITLIGFFVHHTTMQKMKLQNQQTTTEPTPPTTVEAATPSAPATNLVTSILEKIIETQPTTQ